jgi:hypothetical protein
MGDKSRPSVRALGRGAIIGVLPHACLGLGRSRWAPSDAFAGGRLEASFPLTGVHLCKFFRSRVVSLPELGERLATKYQRLERGKLTR